MKYLRLGAVIALCLSTNLQSMQLVNGARHIKEETSKRLSHCAKTYRPTLHERRNQDIPTQYEQLKKYVHGLPYKYAKTYTDIDEWMSFFEALLNPKGWWYCAKETAAIYNELRKHPSKHEQLAEFTASSPFLIREIVKEVRKTKKENSYKPLRICEGGFGMGSVTRKLQTILGSKDVLDAIECDEELYDKAISNFTVDAPASPKYKTNKSHTYTSSYGTKVTLHWSKFEENWDNQDARDNKKDWSQVSENLKYDFVIVTVPFFLLPAQVSKDILEKANAMLKKDGKIVYVTLLGARARCLFTACIHALLGNTVKERACLAKAETVDDETLGLKINEELSLVMWNATPCWVRVLTPPQKAE